jgi:hypothetical protein
MIDIFSKIIDAFGDPVAVRRLGVQHKDLHANPR